MTEQVIKLDGMTLETSKNGKQYNQFQTSIGIIGVFEEEVVKALSQNLGEHVRVNIEVRPNGYKNITKFIGVSDGAEIVTQPQANTQAQAVGGKVVHEIVDNKIQNSAEVGKAGQRIKIYFTDAESLSKQYKDALLAIRAVEAELNSDADKE